jgi:hypothetical protein
MVPLEPASFYFSSHTSPSKADLALKAEQAARYARDLWITLACIIAFVSLCRITQGIFSWIGSRLIQTAEKSGEHGGHHSQQFNRGSSLCNFLRALATAFRITAFRTTLRIGPDAVISLSEFAFIAGYIALMLMFVLIDST